MGSAFFPPGDVPPGFVPIERRRVAWHLHPLLTEILNLLHGTPLGRALHDRAAEVVGLKHLSEPVGHASALRPFTWMLERATGDGLPLTAAGYLRPADVKAVAAELPTMDDWIFGITREVNVQPVLAFRQAMMTARLIRKYKGTLRLTKAGREGLTDPSALWLQLAGSLVPARGSYEADASVIILLHAATTDGRIDAGAIAQTLNQLGWRAGEDPVEDFDVYPVWNDLSGLLGNVGEIERSNDLDRTLSPEARVLINQALFTETTPSSGPDNPAP